MSLVLTKEFDRTDIQNSQIKNSLVTYYIKQAIEKLKMRTDDLEHPMKVRTILHCAKEYNNGHLIENSIIDPSQAFFLVIKAIRPDLLYEYSIDDVIQNMIDKLDLYETSFIADKNLIIFLESLANASNEESVNVFLNDFLEV